jgi:hypothetical protein
MLKFSEYDPTEGKEFLEDFFTATGITFETQKKLDRLKYDAAPNRTADFYLPRYNIYVEFSGTSNSVNNETIQQKKELYAKNNIACIFLYPENLRTIPYNFDKQLQETFKQYQLQKALQKYRLFKFKNAPELRNRVILLGFALLGIITLSLPFITLSIKGYIVLGGLILFSLFHAWQIVQLYLDVFKRNRFPLNRLYKEEDKGL